MSYLVEEYEAGRSPVHFGNRAVSLKELKQLHAIELLGKDVFLLGHPLDIKLRAVDSFGIDHLDVNCFIDRKVISVHEKQILGHICLEVNLAESSMIDYFTSLYEDSAYYVLEEYTSNVFNPIYDGC